LLVQPILHGIMQLAYSFLGVHMASFVPKDLFMDLVSGLHHRGMICLFGKWVNKLLEIGHKFAICLLIWKFITE
jgi:hypothetical protein